MKNFILSLILVMFSATAGAVIFMSWLDTIEEVKKNFYNSYIVVPDVQAKVVTNEDVRTKLISDIQARLIDVNQNITTEDISIDILPKNPEKPTDVSLSKETTATTSIPLSGTTISLPVPFSSQARRHF
jgi:hypothetical protein